MFKVLFFIFLIYSPPHVNENDLYIQKVTSNPGKLIKCGTFEPGQIFIHGNTINVEILKFNKRKDMNSFLFCMIKNKADSIQIYTAKQIDGYSIGTENYRKHISNDAHFFIRLVKNGRAILYERAAIPSDKRYLYYLKLQKYRDYFVLEPVNDHLTAIYNPSPEQKFQMCFYYLNPDNKNEKFKLFIKTYLADCERLNLLMSSNYYTIFDIPSVIEKYNNCFN